MQKLYVDREGSGYYTWSYDEGSKRKFMTGPDLDVIYQKAKKQGFSQAILTPEASEFYYDRPNAPTKVKIGESKVKKPTSTMSKNIETKLRARIRSLVEGILKEEDNKNEIDNRLYQAIKDLGSLCSYLSDPNKPITNDEINKFRNELTQRYKKVDSYIGKYASKG